MTDQILTRIALVGSPNSGKTTLFNALTGSRQKTGNYAGVTVEKKEGIFRLNDGLSLALLDLPGAYSLDARTPDEAITAEMVCGKRADELTPEVIVAVADSTNLDRNLYLVYQLIELGRPMVLALTMSDLAKKSGIEVKREELERRLGIPVVLTSAVKGKGLHELNEKIESILHARQTGASKQSSDSLDNSPTKILARYTQIEETLKSVVSRKAGMQNLTAKIDRAVLHRFWGPIILFTVLAIVFQLIFSFAHLPMDGLEYLVGKAQDLVRAALPDGDLRSLLADGILAGVGSVIVFLPQILLLFAFIILFEDSGYMARAAFILDRLMSKVGLHGRAFIPLLSSFACAIPGIMATRTIENRRDRLITILVAPLMTCSARIPVYALLIAAFVPSTHVFGIFTFQGLVMFGMYLFGIAAALIVAFTLRRTVLKADAGSNFIIDLPTYKRPSMRNLALGLWDRGRVFLRRAGTIILAISIVLWALVTYPKATPPVGADAKTAAAFQIEHSVAGRVGKLMEPAIKPLGYDWRIGIGLLTSFAAREVVVSSLSTVYAVESSESDSSALGAHLKSAPGFSLATAISLLVFYAIACQCMSTIAVVRRETNSWRWPAFMFTYMALLAYALSFTAFRLVTWLSP